MRVLSDQRSCAKGRASVTGAQRRSESIYGLRLGTVPRTLASIEPAVTADAAGGEVVELVREGGVITDGDDVVDG